jgi:hypothetical protein
MVNSVPEGVKFLLDLTPPSEGDDLVFQMTELSLTPGLIKWWTSYCIHKIDPALVSGHDDVCYCSLSTRDQEPKSDAAPDPPYELDSQPEKLGLEDPRRAAKQLQKLQNSEVDPAKTMAGVLNDGARINPETLLCRKALNSNVLYNVPAYRDIPDYCPFRHRNCIIRLLLLIQGEHVMLDSATRIWTLVGVAKILDCPSILRDDVAQWMMHGSNVRFIEVLPEEALQLGYTLQLPEVTQCAFRILVNELALEEAAIYTSRAKPNPVTIFGRRRSTLGDELNNIVQHAARALVERITQDIRRMRANDFLDSIGSREWEKLCHLEKILLELQHIPGAPRVLTRLRNSMDLLRSIVPKILDVVQGEKLHFSAIQHSSMDFDRATYVEPKDFDLMDQIVARLNLTQRFLCPMAYHLMTEEAERAFRLGAMFESCHAFTAAGTQLRQAAEALQSFIGYNPDLAIKKDWEHRCGSAIYTPGFVKSPFNVYQIGQDVKAELQPFLDSWVRHDIDPALNITRHLLLTLNNNELKFLPLWAGGCDDGTGGVFEALVPPTDLGPSGPGPAYHTGFTVPSAPSSTTGTMTEDLGALMIVGSTTAGSVDVHDSISTVYHHDRVIADDVSVMSEAFTETNSAYQDARFAIPAQNQEIGQAIDVLCDISTDGDDADSVTMDTNARMADGHLVNGSTKTVQADNDDISFDWDEDTEISSDDEMELI